MNFFTLCVCSFLLDAVEVQLMIPGANLGNQNRPNNMNGMGGMNGMGAGMGNGMNNMNGMGAGMGNGMNNMNMFRGNNGYGQQQNGGKGMQMRSAYQAPDSIDEDGNHVAGGKQGQQGTQGQGMQGQGMQGMPMQGGKGGKGFARYYGYQWPRYYGQGGKGGWGGGQWYQAGGKGQQSGWGQQQQQFGQQQMGQQGGQQLGQGQQQWAESDSPVVVDAEVLEKARAVGESASETRKRLEDEQVLDQAKRRGDVEEVRRLVSAWTHSDFNKFLFEAQHFLNQADGIAVNVTSLGRSGPPVPLNAAPAPKHGKKKETGPPKPKIPRGPFGGDEEVPDVILTKTTTDWRSWEVKFEKTGKLGLRLAFVDWAGKKDGALEVTRIYDDSIVKKLDYQSPGDQISIGDIVEQINGVSGDSTKMLQEVQIARSLVFKMKRMPGNM